MRSERFTARFGCLAMFCASLLNACAQVDPQQNQPIQVAANSPPQLSGQSATTVVAGTSYQFTPSASDADGDALTFSITNKPAWATFSIATGLLSGTPGDSDVGTYPGIAIAASDGRSNATLQAFALTVVAAGGGGGTGTGGSGSSGGGAVNGSAALAWTAPTKNTDGTPLMDLAGYWVYYGTRADNLARLQRISDPATTQYTVTGLGSGTHFFAVSAFNSTNTESRLSAIGAKTIP